MTIQWMDTEAQAPFTNTLTARRDTFATLIHAQDTKYTLVSSLLPKCDWCHKEIANSSPQPIFHHKIRSHQDRLASAYEEMSNWIAPAEERKDMSSSRFVGGNGAYQTLNGEFNHWLQSMSTRSPSEQASREEVWEWLRAESTQDAQDARTALAAWQRESVGLAHVSTYVPAK